MNKVLVAHIVLSLEVGGLEVLVARMSLQMRKRGYYPTVFCLDAKGSLADQLEEAGIEVICMERQAGMLDFAVLWRMVRLFRKRRFSIIHTHNSEAHLYGNLAGWFAGGVYTVHTQHGIPEGFRGKKRFLARFLGILTDRAVAVSDEVNHYVTASGWFPKRKVQTVFNGIDTACFVPDSGQRALTRTLLGVGADTPLLICVARLAPIKDHRTLISAFLQVVHIHKDAVLLIIGDGPLGDELRQQIADLKLAERVHMLGEIQNVRDYLVASDIFVLTSLSEGISVSLLEAMAVGLVPVVTAVGGNLQIIRDGENGYLVDPEDVEGIAKCLVSLISRRQQHADLASEARQTVEGRFGMEQMLKAYEQLYRDGIAGKG